MKHTEKQPAWKSWPENPHKSWEGKPIVHDRMHWVLTEAVDTTVGLYHETGDSWYADFYEKRMLYLDEKVLDHVNNSWYHQHDWENNLSDTVWPGKPDLYHAFQAMLLPYEPADLSIAVSAYRKQN